MTDETEALRAALAPYLYEAYRLGKYGSQEYLPMWHEKPSSELTVPWPEVDGAVKAALSFIHGASCGFVWVWEGSDDDHLHQCRHKDGHPGRHVCDCRSWQPRDFEREEAQRVSGVRLSLVPDGV
jgi:hypothetical protein